MRWAVFGGSFDPVHRGHLAVADAAHERLEPERFLWVPARQAPHKPDRSPAPDELRTGLLERVLAERPEEELCRLELDRPPPSYSVDTLTSLQAERPGVELCFLIGSDSLAHLGTWRDLPALFELARFVVFPRSGWPEPRLQEFRDGLDAALAARFRAEWLPMPTVDVSSTAIRERLRRGEDCRDWLPESIADAVHEAAAYRGTDPA